MNTPEFRPDVKAPPSPPALHSQIVVRSIGLFRGLTGLAGIMSLVMLAGEVTLPLSMKPSTIIGGFHGRVEAADAAAKIGLVTELTRKNAEAAAQPPAFASMETEAFKKQQDVLADSLATEGAIANTADAACMASRLIPRSNQDWGWLGGLLSETCGMSDIVRADMMATLKHGGQNSVLIQRPRANGAQ